MVDLIITLLTILFIGYFVCSVFNTKFGHAIPIAYVIIVLLQYLAVLIGKLSYFKYVLLISIVLMLAIIIYKKKLNYKQYLNPDFFNVGFLVFVVFFIYLYFVLSNVTVSNMDDISYWGTRLKDMWRIDALYSADQYVVYGGKGYPPFTHLLEISFMKLLGGFDYSYAIFSISSLSFSLFMPLFDNIKKNKKGFVKTVILFFTVLCLMLCVHRNNTSNVMSYVFNSLYVDWLLAFTLMYGFYLIYTFDYDNSFSYIELSFCGIMLIFTKQIGAALLILLFTTSLLHMIIVKKCNFRNMIRFSFALILPLMIFASWNMHYRSIIASKSVVVVSEAPAKTTSNESSFIDTLLTEKNIETAKTFVHFVLFENIMTSPIGLSYGLLVIMATIGLVIFGLVKKKQRDYYVIPLMQFLGAIGYAIGILLAYITVFSDGDTMPLYGRYMQTYTYFGILLLAYLVFLEFELKIKYFIYIAVIMLFVNTNSINNVFYIEDRENFREEEITKIKQWIDNEYNYQNMIIINQTDMRYRALLINNFDEKNKNIEYIVFANDKELERFEEMLGNNEYILIGDYDMNFYLNYWSLLSETELYNSSLYRIISLDDGYDFELIYTWE